MSQADLLESGNQRVRFALIGVLLGALAPLGWTLLHLVFFTRPESPTFEGIISAVFNSSENTVTFLYIGLGTIAVFGSTGLYLGGIFEKLQTRSYRLDRLNSAINEQKTKFEKKFTDQDISLKNFHATHARIQKSIDFNKVIHLTAESLHEILGYDRVNILMLNEKKDALEFAISLGTEKDGDVKGISLPYDERAGVLYKAVRENRIFLIEDMRTTPEDFRLRPPCDRVTHLRSRSFIICPISINGEAVGLFGVDNKSRRMTLNETDVSTVRLFADQVSSALTKIKLLEAVERLTSELQITFSELLNYRKDFLQLTRSLKEGTAHTSKTVSQVAGSAEVIREAVEETSSASVEISTIIEQVSQSIETLHQFMEKSAAAMTQISSSSNEVEQSASRSNEMAETVKRRAEMGVRSVGDTLQGLKGLSDAVKKTSEVIEALSSKSQEIDQIISVINDINQKTNLLSLNAAIIAAQSGEHGRSFGVVAEEIRSLSSETAHSASAIERLIQEIQGFTGEAVRHIGQTRELVDRGIELGGATEKSLHDIEEGSGASMEMAHRILQSAREQAKSSQFVSRSIEDLGEMSSQVSASSQEQTGAIRRIVQAIEEIKTMADEMAEATSGQEKETRNIDSAVDKVAEMSLMVFKAIETRRKESEQVFRQLEQLKGGTEKEEDS